MKVGVAGLGKMGAAIAERLREVGHEVVVWNRSPKATEPFAAAGVRVAATPAELASAVDATLTILTDATAIDTVYRGPTGLLAGDVAGKLVIDMSTVRPHTTVALADAVRKTGATFVECPVGGTTGPARTGKLVGLAGGEAADVARAKPLLDQLCRRVDHVGPVGAGASFKLAINLPLMVYYQALGEAYSLCKHVGLDRTAMIELFADTSGGPNVLKARGPALAKALGGEDTGLATFDLDGIRKDLRTMLEEGAARGYPLPLVERTLAIFDEAAAEGLGPKDGAAILGWWQKKIG